MWKGLSHLVAKTRKTLAKVHRTNDIGLDKRFISDKDHKNVILECYFNLAWPTPIITSENLISITLQRGLKIYFKFVAGVSIHRRSNLWNKKRSRFTCIFYENMDVTMLVFWQKFKSDFVLLSNYSQPFFKWF